MKIVINIVLFILFMTMVILGQQHVGYAGLSVMLIGLAGLLTQLWAYNRNGQRGKF
ncbi:DUF6903 family protein [Lacticaseibacillus saniviri]|uniref:Uncharacterized protein n=2 Tax=Lacticaseibacillus saniviri TaxID=931533 RepID=A0A0R2N0K7_9LACO|nr:hypothetical protein [Lacticaseibacillus saniviri]KRO17533.1 hypothetical protein IV56_GL000149 [Lacticaseibacillus saniviri JCM 17471 = DSM 24301]MCG4282589.1 hypothetical protein [Lacticaseibacillus saniviri]